MKDESNAARSTQTPEPDTGAQSAGATASS